MPGKAPPKAVQDRALQQVRDAWDECQKDHTQRAAARAKWYYRYRSVLSQNTVDRWGLNTRIFVPETFHNVETILPRIRDSILGADPAFEILPREPQDEAAAKVTQAKLQYDLDVCDIRRHMEDGLRGAGIYGTGIFKLAWERRVERIAGNQMETTWDGPRIWSRPIEHFFAPSVALGVQREDTPYVVDRTYRTKDQLLSMERAGAYFGVKDLAERASDERLTVNDALSQAKKSMAGETFPETEPVHGRYEVLEYWGLFAPREGEEPVEYLITTIGLHHVIRCEPNPYQGRFRPFVKVDYLCLPGEFWGIGVAEQLDSIQVAMNALTNLRFDNVISVVNRMFFYDSTAGLRGNQITPRPFGLVPVDNINGIREMNLQDVTGSAFTEMGLLQDMARRTTGALDSLAGEMSSKRATAHEVASNVMEAGQRLSTPIQNAERAFEQMLNQMLLLNIQFLDTPTAVRILGEQGYQWTQVNRDDMARQYDIRAVGSRTAGSKTAKQAQLLQFIQVLGPLLKQYVDGKVMEIKSQGAVRIPVDLLRIIRKVWEGFGYTEPILVQEQPQAAGMPPPDMMAMMEQALRGGGNGQAMPGLEPSRLGDTATGFENGGPMAAPA